MDPDPDPVDQLTRIRIRNPGLVPDRIQKVLKSIYCVHKETHVYVMYVCRYTVYTCVRIHSGKGVRGSTDPQAGDK
jgi:hypothetical protein